jgi:hypothetical protein
LKYRRKKKWQQTRMSHPHYLHRQGLAVLSLQVKGWVQAQILAAMFAVHQKILRQQRVQGQ